MAELGGVRDALQTSQYLSDNIDHWAHHGFGVWVLRERGRSDFVGRAILRCLSLEAQNEVEIGFALHTRFWGLGLATEVARTCAALAWRHLEVESLVGVTTPGNRASQGVLLKLGFGRERDIMIHDTRCVLYRCGRPSLGPATS